MRTKRRSEGLPTIQHHNELELAQRTQCYIQQQLPSHVCQQVMGHINICTTIGRTFIIILVSYKL